MPRKREDLTGRKFGKLTVVRYDKTDPHGETFWFCKCDCGNPNLVSVRRQSLMTGSTSSCGCLRHEHEDLTGQRFNRLTAIGFAGRDRENKALWRCRCDCGNETVVDGWNLKSGHVKSCGCFNTELLVNRSLTHGHTGESIYNVWKAMKARCSNPNNHAYKNYGERGVSVCDEWCNNFKAFYDWAIINGYKPGLAIDRINNDGSYCPENCRWATNLEQSNNRRSCRKIEYDGVTHTIAEWSRILGVNYEKLRSSIDRGDMSIFERHFGG